MCCMRYNENFQVQNYLLRKIVRYHAKQRHYAKLITSVQCRYFTIEYHQVFLRPSPF